MSYLNNQKNHAAQFLGLALAAAVLTCLFSVISYPGTRPSSAPKPSGPAPAQVAAPSWTLTGDLNTKRYGHTATLLPNGKVLVAANGKIAFSASESIHEIHSINADGSNEINLPGFDVTPVWSPDGSRIAFTRNSDIYVMNADGSNPTRLTNDPADDLEPGWSPDGPRPTPPACRRTQKSRWKLLIA